MSKPKEKMKENTLNIGMTKELRGYLKIEAEKRMISEAAMVRLMILEFRKTQ